MSQNPEYGVQYPKPSCKEDSQITCFPHAELWNMWEVCPACQYILLYLALPALGL